MNLKIHSRVDPGLLLASVTTVGDQTRTDAAGTDQILQVSGLRLAQGKIIRAHRHRPIERLTQGTQEAWVVMHGQVAADIFDLDNTLVQQTVLTTGDCMVLYCGGHSFTVLTDEVELFEIKNGPYYGAELDSESIC